MSHFSLSIPIESIDDWFRLAPPQKGEKHWKDKRSAKELAKAWFATGQAQAPPELLALFKSHPATVNLVLESGTPEVETRLDDFGKGRHHDLVLLGVAAGLRTLVSVEAKADEEFGPLIGPYRTGREGTSSKVPARIDLLCQSIFGKTLEDDPGLGQLRYQLLHGVAGTLIETRKRYAAQAVFVVHEFLSDEVNEQKMERNHHDLEFFVHALPGLERTDFASGQLVGPIQVPGGKFVPSEIPLLVGKITTNLRSDDHTSGTV